MRAARCFGYAARMLFEELTEVLDPEPHAAALNMAIDEVLLRTARAPLLRIYRWARPAVSFGYFVKHAGVARAWPAHELVRRWTGGGVVPHGDDVTYTLVVPRGCPFFEMRPAESYRAIHEIIAALLAQDGEPIALAPVAALKVSDACFENAARHDVLAGARKIAGAAQRRTREGLLHQGSVQASSPAFAENLALALAGRVSQRPLAARTLADAAALAAAKYATPEWTRGITAPHAG